MDQIPDGSVIITPNEIFRELRDTHDEVKSLGAQVSALTTNVSTRVDALERDSKEFDGRLAVLEQFRWKLLGAAVIVSGAASYGASLLIR